LSTTVNNHSKYFSITAMTAMLWLTSLTPTTSETHWMQVKLFSVTFDLNGRLHGVSIGKPHVWTDVKFLDSSFFLNESEQVFSFPHTPINNLLQYLTITLITEIVTYCSHGDLSPDNVKFPDISLMVRGTPADVKCYSYHACTSVTVSGGGLGVGMQQCMIQNQYERHKLSKVETILKTGK